MIYITGDIHGNIDIMKLSDDWLLPEGLAKNDYVIICGDFGLVWHERDDEDERWLNWLDERPFTTLFVDGNHENHDLLKEYPVETWRGGNVHRIRDSVIHLMRGQVFTIDGMTFFTMGGAYSHDIERRVEGVSWWASEVPDDIERRAALATLDAHGWKVDYVITHCGPTSALPPCRLSDPVRPDEYTDWLERTVNARLDFKGWFFGHYHRTQPMTERHWCLYNGFYDLQEKALLGLRDLPAALLQNVKERSLHT